MSRGVILFNLLKAFYGPAESQEILEQAEQKRDPDEPPHPIDDADARQRHDPRKHRLPDHAAGGVTCFKRKENLF